MPGFLKAAERIAVFALVLALLGPAICPAQIIGVHAAAQPIHSGCHDSMPAAPDDSSPQQKCCLAPHGFAALPIAQTASISLFIVSLAGNAPPFALSHHSHSAGIPSPANRHCGPLVLRI